MMRPSPPPAPPELPPLTLRELAAWAVMAFSCWAGITLVVVLWWEGRL